MNMLSYELEKAMSSGHRKVPSSKRPQDKRRKKYKYKVVIKRINKNITPLSITDSCFQINIWNKFINSKAPLVCVQLNEYGDEVYSNIKGSYPFAVKSSTVFSHYRKMEKLLKCAKRKALSMY